MSYNLTSTDLLAYDREHIWHPYTSIENALPVQHVVGAEGVYLKLANGKELIDGMSSWWTAIHGYNHPVLNAAIEGQLKDMAHVMFGGLTHTPAIELAKLLVEITPNGLDKVFYSDSGSVSVEVAIKMAHQYWHSSGKPQKQKLLTIRSGYHGDTFKAMSVSDPDTGMHTLFKGAFPVQYFAAAPRTAFDAEWNEKELDSIKEQIEEHHHELAAVILEPIVQGAGAMWFYAPQFLKAVRRYCDEYGILLIADEIATGFGRTGKLFAVEHADITPDIMCVGKALTGGYLSLAATITTSHISETISSGTPGVFMHGPTFMGNALACSVALASTRLLLSSSWEKQVQRIANKLKKALQQLNTLSSVKEVRVLGAIGVVEMREMVDVATLQEQFITEGVWIRPFRNLVYVMPPFVITDEQLETLTGSIIKVLSKNERE